VYFIRLISSVYSFPSFSELKLLVFVWESSTCSLSVLVESSQQTTATDIDSSCHSPQHQETALPYEQSKELSTAGRENETDNSQTIPYNNGYYHITIKMNKEHKNKKKK
jgi:hypothetical protein